MKCEGIREEEEDGSNSIGIDNKYERAHPICHGCFSQYCQSYGATFHSNHRYERHYFLKQYSPHPHLGMAVSVSVSVSVSLTHTYLW